MSEEDISYTSILLPSARVALFTRDAETRETFQSLSGDWRFARVALESYEGDVEAAANMYASAASPSLVIVQTDNINDGFIEKLETLGANCGEATAAIVIGPVNDVNLYRKLVGMGVSDYLVKPLKADLLANEIAATLIEQIGATGSRLIAFLGAKGGVGTTVLSEGLAWGISDVLGQKTFLLDAAGGWSTLSVGMNFEPATTLPEAAKAAYEGKQDSLSRMVFKASDKLFVLSTGGDVMLDDTAKPEGYEALLDHMMQTYPVLVVDLSGATAALKRVVLTKAHEIIIVATPTLPSVRAARTLVSEIKDLRGGSDESIDVVINMQGFSPRYEVPKIQIEEGLERKIAATIPFDPVFFVKTESEAGKMGSAKPGAAAIEQMLVLVKKILASTGAETSDSGKDESKKGGIADLLSKLKVKQ